MKVIDIALKDLLRSFRSAFLLVMMFVAPLLITGLLYLAFGGLLSGSGGISLPRPAVLVVNLDRPAPDAGFNAGELLAQHLAGPSFAQLLDARPAAQQSEADARLAVDRHQADVAVIIPANFTAAATQPEQAAKVLLYYHPDSTLGARIVRVLVSDFVDGFTGAKIAVYVATHPMEDRNLTLGEAGAQAVAQAYVAWVQSRQPGSGSEAPDSGTPPGEAIGSQAQAGGQASPGGSQGQSILNTRAPAAKTPTNQATLFLGPVMSGLMVFFMFFTGAAAAMSILYEEQDGTLARLFSTPTPQASILAGKFLGVVVTLFLQAVVLMVASALLFGIQWGQIPSVVLLTCGVVVAAAGFGILLMSFIRSTRQAGPVMGVVITLTGLLAGLMPTGDPSQPPVFEKFTLLLPQGWAQHAWRLVLAGSGPDAIVVPILVLVAVGAACFGVGTLLFRRRFQ
jgi:ABC-type multidrug transport system permease subunit